MFLIAGIAFLVGGMAVSIGAPAVTDGEVRDGIGRGSDPYLVADVEYVDELGAPARAEGVVYCGEPEDLAVATRSRSRTTRTSSSRLSSAPASTPGRSPSRS
jgi:hypothetical protein